MTRIAKPRQLVTRNTNSRDLMIRVKWAVLNPSYTDSLLGLVSDYLFFLLEKP